MSLLNISLNARIIYIINTLKRSEAQCASDSNFVWLGSLDVLYINWITNYWFTSLHSTWDSTLTKKLLLSERLYHTVFSGWVHHVRKGGVRILSAYLVLCSVHDNIVRLLYSDSIPSVVHFPDRHVLGQMAGITRALRIALACTWT